MREPLRQLTDGRIPPQAVAIEKQVLGAMIYENSCIRLVRRILTPDDFYADHHRKIYEGIVELDSIKSPVDLITLSDGLRKKGSLELVGGETYLVELTMGISSSANAIQHSKIVLEKSILRQQISICTATASRGFSPTEDALHLLDETADKIVGLRGRVSLIAERDTTDQLEEFIAYADRVMTGQYKRIPIHIESFNKLSKGGARPGSYIFVGAEPGGGKTSFLLQMAYHAANNGFQTEFIEGEMTSDELYERLLGQTMRRNIDEALLDKEAIVEFANVMYSLPLKITTDVFPRDAATLESTVMRAILRGAKFIIVDYLQVFANKGSDEFAHIKAISEMLRAKCLEYKVVICVASSLARGKERKGMDRFYGGAQLMHDCSIAMLLDGEQQDDEIATGVRRVVLKVPKNRGGARTGEDGITLRYDLFQQRFTEYYDQLPPSQESVF